MGIKVSVDLFITLFANMKVSKITPFPQVTLSLVIDLIESFPGA